MSTTIIPVTRAQHFVPDDEAYLPSPTRPAIRTLRDDAGCVALPTTHLFVMHDVDERRMVTLAASPNVAGDSYYEFDLSPESARQLAAELVAGADSAERADQPERGAA